MNYDCLHSLYILHLQNCRLSITGNSCQMCDGPRLDCCRCLWLNGTNSKVSSVANELWWGDVVCVCCVPLPTSLVAHTGPAIF